MLIRSRSRSEKNRPSSGDGMQRSPCSFRSYFRAPNGQLVACSLVAAAPAHAVMCRLKNSPSWFVNHAYMDRQTAEEDVAKQRSIWERHAIDHVIVEQEMTDPLQFGNK